MTRTLRALVAGTGAAVVLAALPAAAAAAPASTTFTVQGFETAATPTQGTFSGSATGNAGEAGIWRAVVNHTGLASLPATITGGTFSILAGGAGGVDVVNGTFTGGSVAVVNPGAGCTNQTFAVNGSLGSVSTRTSSGGTGTFEAVLTHYRLSFLGNCMTFAASVAGTATFRY